jgi:hypothetical protein
MVNEQLAMNEQVTQLKDRWRAAEAPLIGLGLFLLALLPRAYALQRFVTADEAKWVYRSAQFLAALLRGDFAGMTVNLTPAVTTTWLGSIGLAIHYQLHRAAIDLPFADWLTSLPEFRTELDILAATRWPMVMLTSLSVVLSYYLLRRLLNPTIALITAAFIALDPHFVALSRVLGHDAPTTVFMTLSILGLLLAIKPTSAPDPRGDNPAVSVSSATSTGSSHSLWLLSLSGMAAGLAFLSKAPALFLIPFTALVLLSNVWRNSAALTFWFKRLLLWSLAAYLTFAVVWPAAWVDPLGRPMAVFKNAFLSATDEEEAGTEGHWLVPDLGPFYYVVNGGFKLSPLVMIGLGLAGWQLAMSNYQLANSTTPVKSQSKEHNKIILWFLAFAVLFTIFLTTSEKRSARYILPALPALAVVAAYGWLRLYHVAGGKFRDVRQAAQVVEPTTDQAFRPTFVIILIVSALVTLLPYAPYYFTYFNPLLGGSYTAPGLVKIGWGEGLDQVGRYLQRVLPDSRVGTAYASTVAPYFEGDLSSVTGSNLEVVVLYSKQVQSGTPSPAFIRYFEQIGPIFSVDLNSIHYADVYPGPAIQPSLGLTPGLDTFVLPKPIGFRPLTPYGSIGEALDIDVLWLADEPLPRQPSTVALAPLSAFDFSHQGHDHGETAPVSDDDEDRTLFAEGQGQLTRWTDNLIVSRHRLLLPPDLPRGVYALLVDGRPLGELELRRFQLPDQMKPLDGLVFDKQIALRGFDFTLTADYIDVTMAWQAQTTHLPDYTVFVQLLEAETNERVAGIDTQPVKGEWPTSRWVKNEVVVDNYLVAIPPDFQPGVYKIIAGLYRPETGQRLTLPDGQDYWTLPSTLFREEE